MQANRFAYAVLFTGLLGVASIPSPLPSTPVPAQDPDGFVLEAGEHDIREMIDRAAKFLGRNYVYSAQDMQNAPSSTIKLQNRLVLDAVGCDEVVGQLAYTMGFAMIPIDEKRGMYEWIYRQGPKRVEMSTRAVLMSAEETLRNRGRQIQVLTSIPLKHINATSAQNTLRPFFLGGGAAATGAALQFGVAGDSLLLQGFAPQVAYAILLMREVDRAAQPPQRLEDWRRQIDQRVQALEAARKAKKKT